MKLLRNGGNSLTFDNGSILGYEHEQDCCEQVYADFENMQIITDVGKNHVDAMDLDFFDDILKSIVPIADLGFYIVTKQGICILVSCYNNQSGYYSSNLKLEFIRNIEDNENEEMDITECTKFGWE